MTNLRTIKIAFVAAIFTAHLISNAPAADHGKLTTSAEKDLRAEVELLRRENLELAERLSKTQRAIEAIERAYDAVAPGSRLKVAALQAKSCIANLKQLDGATQQWALENKKAGPDVPVMSGVVKYLKGEKLPDCPRGGVYSLGKTVAKEPTCSCPGHTL